MYYSVNLSNANTNEARTTSSGITAASGVLACVPAGCTATKLAVYSQRSGTITVILRMGTPSSMSNSTLAVTVSNNSSRSETGSVTVSPGQFIDYTISGASRTAREYGQS